MREKICEELLSGMAKSGSLTVQFEKALQWPSADYSKSREENKFAVRICIMQLDCISTAFVILQQTLIFTNLLTASDSRECYNTAHLRDATGHRSVSL